MQSFGSMDDRNITGHCNFNDIHLYVVNKVTVTTDFPRALVFCSSPYGICAYANKASVLHFVVTFYSMELYLHVMHTNKGVMSPAITHS